MAAVTIVGNRAEVWVRVVVDEVIPVTIVHLVPESACSLVEAFEEAFFDAGNRDRCNDDDLLLVRAEDEALDVAVEL